MLLLHHPVFWLVLVLLLLELRIGVGLYTFGVR
jgi:hypothetical protein